MVKYSLSTREIPRAERKGFPDGSGNISLYIPTPVIIKTLSIKRRKKKKKSFTGGQYEKICLFVLLLKLGQYFPVQT